MENIQNIEARVNKLENYVWLAAVLLVVFGIGGGVLWSKLLDAQKTAENLKSETEKSVKQIEKIGQEQIKLISQSKLTLSTSVEQAIAGTVLTKVKHIEEIHDVPSHTYHRRLEFESSGLLFIVADGNHHFDAKARQLNAGIEVNIAIDGRQCARNKSFEALASNIVFYASATCVIYIEKGKHEIIASRLDHKHFDHTTSKSHRLGVSVYFVEAKHTK